MTAVAPVGEQTRERILRLADDLFAEHGYARVSMRAVAGAAGVTKPALYYHFRDKEALYEECLSANQRRMGTLLRDSSSGDAALSDRILGLTRILLTGSRHHPVRTQSDIAEHLPADARGRLTQGFQDSVMAPLCEAFQAAEDRGELRDGVTVGVAAAALLGLVMPFLVASAHGEEPAWRPQARPRPEGAPEPGGAAELITGLALRGVAGG